MSMLQSFSAWLASVLHACTMWCRGAPAIDLPKHRVHIVKQLADGATGIVYLAQDSRKRQFALKKIMAQSNEQIAAAVLEIKMYSQLKHPNLVPLKDSLRKTDPALPNQTDFYLLFPFFEMGSLDVELTKRDFSELEALQLFHGICLGLNAFHAHQPPLAHRDMKPGNVLLYRRPSDQVLVPLLTDFGSVSTARTHVQSRRQAMQLQEWAAQNCTMSYRAPELFDVPSNCILDERSDVWSLGCLLYAIAFHRSPFDLPDTNLGGSIALAVISGKYDIPASNRYSKGFIALIAAMLQSKLEDRPFVPAIAARVESMLREHGVSITTPTTQRSEFDSDDENDSLTGVRLDMRT